MMLLPYKDQRLFAFFILILAAYFPAFSASYIDYIGIQTYLLLSVAAPFSVLLLFVVYARLDFFIVAALLAAFSSSLIGVAAGFSIRDNVADLIRFLLPFLGYSVAVGVLGRMRTEQLFQAIRMIIGALIVLLVIDLMEKVVAVGLGAPIFDYGGDRIEVSPFLFSYSILNYSTWAWIIFAVGLVAFPFLSMSKTLFVLAVTSIGLHIFFSGLKRARRTLVLIVGAVMVFSAVLVFTEGSEFSLLTRLASVTSENSRDGSTEARIVEATNAVCMLTDEPLTLIFGQGNGALWYQKCAVLQRGLNDDNFRVDGGGHHIHMTPFALLFRNGIVGVLLYIVWFVYGFLVIRRLPWKMRVPFLVYMLSDAAAMLFTYRIYSSIDFSLVMAMGVVLSRRLAHRKTLEINRKTDDSTSRNLARGLTS